MATPKLPYTNISDGDQVVDQYGNIYEYNLEQDEWIFKGSVQPLANVSHEEDGLVTPDVYRKIELLQELMDQGFDFSVFKLKTNSEMNPYFYYFYSSDNLIRFIPEASNKLRVEIDRARLYQKLVRNCCVGPKGPTGDQGDTGNAGTPADPEVYQIPDSTVNGVFSLSKVVNTPIDTDISLRVYNEVKLEVAEFIIPLDGSDISFSVLEGYTVNDTGTSIEWNPTSNTLDAIIDFGADVTRWIYKVRQKGPTGDAGDDGKSFLEIVNTSLSDPSLLSESAIVSLRKSGISDISFLQKNMYEEVAVSNLSATAATFPPDNSLLANFVCTEVTTRDVKSIGVLDLDTLFDFDVDDIGDLDLPAWTPPDGCGQLIRWGNYRYNWWDYLDVEYTFRIMPTLRPPEQCCESEFFWCPNVGDQPCGITGTVGDPEIEMPKKFAHDCECECEDPIALELQSSGFIFDRIDTTSDEFANGDIIIRSINSVLNGSIDNFTLDVVYDQRVVIDIVVDADPEVCGGENEERDQCAYIDTDRLYVSANITDLAGSAVHHSPTFVESEDFPARLSFDVEPHSFVDSGGNTNAIVSSYRLTLNVNNTKMALCKGYKVIIQARRAG